MQIHMPRAVMLCTSCKDVCRPRAKLFHNQVLPIKVPCRRPRRRPRCKYPCRPVQMLMQMSCKTSSKTSLKQAHATFANLFDKHSITALMQIYLRQPLTLTLMLKLVINLFHMPPTSRTICMTLDLNIFDQSVDIH